MKENLELRIFELSQEAQRLSVEKEELQNRANAVDVRIHQLVGAIHELQFLLNQVNQPSVLIETTDRHLQDDYLLP